MVMGMGPGLGFGSYIVDRIGSLGVAGGIGFWCGFACVSLRLRCR